MSEPTRAAFLSYASQDAEAARRICEALRSGGVEVWFDQSELRGGDAWDRQIRRQIRDCSLFIPIISANTQARPEGYFRLEWKLAVERTHLMSERMAFVVPVVTDATRDQDADVPEAFKTAQWTRLPGGETPPAFVERVAHLMSPGLVQSPPSRAPAPAGHSAPQVSSRPLAMLRPRRLLPWLLGVVVLALGYFALDRSGLWKRPVTPAAPPAAAVQPGLHANDAIPEKSIAVLPFIDMSEKKDQQYFSDGLAEELLDLLAQVPDLRVSARTSSFSFRATSDDVPTIAHKLRVANVLEGSVRKVGSAIRVTVQLIRADSGYHLWSKTYDRNVRDIFKVQDEIATAVVSALKTQLLPSQQISNRHRTGNPEAYAQYLIGNRLRYQDTPDSNQQALAAYQKAIALDPGYAAAYAALADAEWRIADEVTGDAAGYARAQAAAEKSIALAPDSPEGYWARGLYRYSSAFDWQGAEADLKQALALEPNFAPARSEYAAVLATLGRLPEAIVEMNKALLVDPLSGPSSYRLTIVLLAAGRGDEARRLAQRMVEGNIPGAHEVRGYLALLSGDAQQADIAFQREPLRMAQLYTRTASQFSLGHQSASDGMLAELIRDYASTQAYQIAQAYAWRGEKDKAFEWLQTAYRHHDRGMTELSYDPMLARLRDDPRYHALLRQMNLPG